MLQKDYIQDMVTDSEKLLTLKTISLWKNLVQELCFFYFVW